MNTSDATFIDEFTAFGMAIGLPRSAARVLGFLHICTPNLQSYSQIQDTLALSTGSVSIATKLLEDMQLIERVRLPGDKRHYYRLVPDGFVQATKRRLETFGKGRELASRRLESQPNDERLVMLERLYGFLDGELKGVARKLDEL